MGLLPNSIQQKYTSAFAVNIVSAVVNQWTIAAAQKEAIKNTFDFIAKDEAKAGGVWGLRWLDSVRPAVISTPSYPAILRPLMFYDAGVSIGGTTAYSATTKKITVTGGTAYPKINNIQIVVNNAVDAEAYGLSKPDPTIQEAQPGDREITVSFDISWVGLRQRVLRRGTRRHGHGAGAGHGRRHDQYDVQV